ncbi:MAG: hypothetical protein L3J65_11065 [Robiginitomaculum sp.]|nr:hypothetical protein [Robiginitomaculum sp.]
MTVSYEAIEVAAAPKPVDPVDEKIKAEPKAPTLPKPGEYGASDIRAQKLGLYAVSLRKWGRGLVTAITAREKADAALRVRQQLERDAVLAKIEQLNIAEYRGGE